MTILNKFIEFYYRTKRKIKSFTTFPRELKFRVQNGFWPHEWWEFFSYTAEYILPRLKYFRKRSVGAWILDENGNPSIEKTNEALDAMILSFQMILDENTSFLPFNFEKYKQDQQIIQKGLHLFATHFESLWD